MLLSSFALPRLIGAGTGTTIPRASHGRGVRWAQGQGHGVRQRGGPRGVCLPARADRTAAEHTPRPQSSQQATCAKRADARQGRWRGQAAREVRPHRSTDANAMPTRGSEGGVKPGGAGAGASRHTGRRRRAQAREAPPQDASHSSPLHARGGDPREARRAKGGCRGGGGGCATHQRAICHGAALLRRPSQPPRPERAPTDQRA
jgi:hypothetical protein